MKKKVAVGLSGGIDSSFAAYLLHQQGFDVVGVTLKFQPQDNRCCDLDSLYQAQRLCHKLEIPHYVFDVKDIFQEKIISYFVKDYLSGLTPNPCAFCNRFIKFGYLYQKIKSLGIDYLATGHYVRLKKNNGNILLQSAKDVKKSQEYFLALVNPAILDQLIFPLGDYLKDDVKQIVKNEKVFFKERKESQDICFINGKAYQNFIEENITNRNDYIGFIKYIDGRTLGTHKGTYYFTYGQREGLGIAWREPLYVVGIDSKNKTVIVGERKYLGQNKLQVTNCNWFIGAKNYENIKVRIRYNSPAYDCNLTINGNDVEVNLKSTIEAVTPGQIAVFYDNDLVLGAGIITNEKNNK